MHDQEFIDTDHETYFSVDRVAYTCPDVWRAELRKIFDRCWLYLCHESELRAADSFLTRQVGGRPVLAVRDEAGDIRAFLNACSHRGAVVCQAERGSGKRFTCPYHGWTYDQRGAVVGMPGRDAYGTGEEFRRHGLPPLAVESYRGFVFLCFTPPARSLTEHLGTARDYIDLVCDQSEGALEIIPGEHRHAIHANWKLLAENGVDAYHLPVAHKRFLDWLNELGSVPGSHKRSGVGLDLGNGHAVIKSGPPSTGRPIAYWSPLFPEAMKPVIEERWLRLAERVGEERAADMARTNRSLFIFPNLVINDILGLNLRTFFPVAPDRVSITVWGAGFSDEGPEDRAIRVSNLISFIGPGGFGTPDDVEILESCQRAYGHRGIGRSDFSRGMAPGTVHHTDEAQNRAFWRAWGALMGEGDPLARPDDPQASHACPRATEDA